MNKKKLYWTCQISGWMLFVLLNVFFLKEDLNLQMALHWLLSFTLGIGITELFRSLVLRWDWLKMSVSKQILRAAVSSICMGVLFVIGVALLENFSEMESLKWSAINTSLMYINVANLTFVFFFWSLIYFLFHYIDNYKKAEIENLKWQASINEIELNKLKSQLNPHFMFNAMNSIRALVDENPQRAKDSITQLSNILRNTMLMSKKKVISFDEEMKIVKDYLSLESTRFEERLRYSLDIHSDSRNFDIPPLMLQTLVENAIKHGISRLMNGGEVEICTNVLDDKLHISIINSGQLNTSIETDSGYGLENTRRRLDLLYGSNASFRIFNDTIHTVKTELIISKIYN